MTVMVLHNADLGLNIDLERCCLCWLHTNYWADCWDRIPLCEECARKPETTEVRIPGRLAYRTILRAKSEIAHRELARRAEDGDQP